MLVVQLAVASRHCSRVRLTPTCGGMGHLCASVESGRSAQIAALDAADRRTERPGTGMGRIDLITTVPRERALRHTRGKDFQAGRWPCHDPGPSGSRTHSLHASPEHNVALSQGSLAHSHPASSKSDSGATSFANARDHSTAAGFCAELRAAIECSGRWHAAGVSACCGTARGELTR